MDSTSEVAEAPATAKKHGSRVGLAPMFGLLGGAAFLLAACAFVSPERVPDWDVRGTRVIIGASLLGALLAAWGVGAKSRGRNVPTALLVLAACTGWLVALPLSVKEALHGFEAVLQASSDRVRLLGGANTDSASLRLLGVLLSTGVLLGTAIGLARAATRNGAVRWNARGLMRGLLLTPPVLALPAVAALSTSEGTGSGSLTLLLFPLVLAFLALGVGVAPTLESQEPRTAGLATGALWTGGLGVVTGCVGLGTTVYVAACSAINSVNPVDTLFLLNEHAHELGSMKKVTAVAFLVCTVPPALLAVHAARRGARGTGLVVGTFGALLLAPGLVSIDALAAKYIDDQLALHLRGFGIPKWYEPVLLPGAYSLDEPRAESLTDADVVLTPIHVALRSGEVFPLDVLDEERDPRFKQRLVSLLQTLRTRNEERSRKEKVIQSEWLSLAVDAGVEMPTLSRFLTVAHRSGARSLHLVGKGSEYGAPNPRSVVLENVPSLAPALDAPGVIKTWLHPPTTDGDQTQLVLRARLSGEGPFTVASPDSEGPRFEVDPSRPSSKWTDEPDTVRGLGLQDGPAPVVWLDAGSAPNASSLLAAATALRVRGFEVALNP